jgi:hypothetical protein
MNVRNKLECLSLARPLQPNAVIKFGGRLLALPVNIIMALPGTNIPTYYKRSLITDIIFFIKLFPVLLKHQAMVKIFARDKRTSLSLPTPKPTLRCKKKFNTVGFRK